VSAWNGQWSAAGKGQQVTRTDGFPDSTQCGSERAEWKLRATLLESMDVEKKAFHGGLRKSAQVHQN
jgi:hypothetical protein